MEEVYLGGEVIDLRVTLMDSAQCFCWTEKAGRFFAMPDGRPVCVWCGEGGVYALGSDREWLRKYLDLDRDYAASLEEYKRFPQCRQAIGCFGGLRVLKQSTWDALVQFILTANNNVARIRKLTMALSEALGEAGEVAGERVYGIPSPAALARTSEAELRGLGVGYRAPYLIESSRMVLNGFPLDQLEKMPYEKAHEELLRLPGVGDKVADCVLLFGCRRMEAFPVDVWVERLLGAWFGIHDRNRLKLARRAQELLGDNAGLLQQYLFHAARTGAISL